MCIRAAEAALARLETYIHHPASVTSAGVADKPRQVGSVAQDGHAPEVVPADEDLKTSAARPGRKAVKASRSQGKSTQSSKTFESTETKPKEQAVTGSGGEGDRALAADSNRRSASPVFLSPATSLNSNSSSVLSSGMGDSKEADSLADAIAASGKPSTQSERASDSAGVAAGKDKPTAAKLSSAALKSMEGAKSNKGGKASSRASAKSHSRASSVAGSEWHDVELQSEAEEEGGQDEKGRVRQSGPPPARPHAAQESAVSAADDYVESDNESELGIVESEELGQRAERAMVPSHGM